MNLLTEVKGQIKASDEEWKVIGPLLLKVVTQRNMLETSGMEGNMGGGPGGFGGRGGRGGGPGGGNDAFGGPGQTATGNRGFGGPGGEGGGRRGRGGFGGEGGPGGFRGGPDSGPGGPGNNGSGGAPQDVVVNTNPGGNAGNTAAAATPTAQANGPSRNGMTLTQTIAELRTALANDKTTPEQFKEIMGHVRAARERTKKELDAAQKELLLVITPDQEAVLAAQGYID
jgi:hypothetical protein